MLVAVAVMVGVGVMVGVAVMVGVGVIVGVRVGVDVGSTSVTVTDPLEPSTGDRFTPLGSCATIFEFTSE